MKKIMFNDKYGLTDAVLEGRKTMARRILKAPRTMEGKDVYGFAVVTYSTGEVAEVMALDEDEAMINNIMPKYKPGEVVAVAQNLRDMGYDPRATPGGAIWGLDHTPAWTNKMFVSASQCKHQIRITNVRIERLKDISDEDCLKEGVQREGYGYYVRGKSDIIGLSAKSVFEILIDKISGKGTWNRSPFVYVYEFELLK